MKHNNLEYTKHEKLVGKIFIMIIMIAIAITLLSGCGITYTYNDPIYEDHPHTTEVYHYNELVYFGYWDGFYYYYGTPHFYPWWYYYQFLPPYHHHIHTHVHIHCDNGYYIYGHRGDKFNNKDGGNFTTEIKLRNPKSKTNVFPRNWKSNNSTRINKQNDNIIKNNIKPNIIRNFNKNRSNNKTRINQNGGNNRKNRKSNR